MQRKVLFLFLTLLVAAFMTALAQSPTSSNPGGSETKDPYGATLDHPNPGSAQGATGQSYDKNKVNEGQTPASPTPTTAAPVDNSGSMTATTTPSTSSTDTSSTSSSSSTSDLSGAKKSLPRTASELPLLATIGLLALGGALMVRSIARRSA
jgi:hypothetical protein